MAKKEKAKKSKYGGALPVTESESKKYGVRTGKKYRVGRGEFVEKKWGGRRYNRKSSPVIGESGSAGGTILEEGRRQGLYKKKKKK